MKQRYELNDLIYLEKDSLSKEFCQHLIDKFEADERKWTGRIGTAAGGGINLAVKQSTDLNVTMVDGWEEEQQTLTNILAPRLETYINNMVGDQGEYLKTTYIKWIQLSQCSGYQIQRTEPSKGYIWHDDAAPQRMLTFLWYLNDVEEGGYTEFCDGTKVQPEMGKLMLFPAFWTHIHRGYPPKKDIKYICTGWILSPYK